MSLQERGGILCETTTRAMHEEEARVQVGRNNMNYLPQHLCPFEILPSVWLLPVASETDALRSCGSHAAAGQRNLNITISYISNKYFIHQ